jgi:hypothetical protein
MYSEFGRKAVMALRESMDVEEREAALIEVALRAWFAMREDSRAEVMHRLNLRALREVTTDGDEA